MKIFLPFVCILIYLNCFAQEANSAISGSGTIESFVPPGWRIVSRIEDDFNKDSLVDYALILQSKDTIKDSSPIGYYQPKTLIVLFQKADKTFEKSIETSKLFGKGNWGVQSTDPFAKLLPDNGRIKISFTTGGCIYDLPFQLPKQELDPQPI